MMNSELVAIRKQAENAVSDMPEGDIKVKAFETILTHLLSSPTQGQPEPRTKSKPQPAEKPRAKESATSSSERILSLKQEGFFKTQKSIAEIRAELKKNGWHYPVTSLSGRLQALVQKRHLRRENVDDADGRKGWKYSNP